MNSFGSKAPGLNAILHTVPALDPELWSNSHLCGLALYYGDF